MEIRTHILDILDQHGIPYRRLPHREAVFTVEAAARQRGVREEEMVKSILLRDKAGRYVMACVPGHRRVNPVAVRALLPPDWRRLTFASADEIRAVTGCPQGAVAPVGLPDSVPVIFDQTLLSYPQVNISSGDPWLGLELDPRDLLRVARAQVGVIVE